MPPSTQFLNPTRKTKATLVTLGTILATAGPFLPGIWGYIATGIGGLLGGGALIRRPGDCPKP